MKISKKIIFFLVIPVLAIFICLFLKKENQILVSPYPDGKNFAFTITDDPDYSKVKKIKPVYDLLLKNGFKTTLGVWVKEAQNTNGLPEEKGFYDYGETCQRKEYFAFVRNLQREGFEIALHTVSGGNDYREDTKEGYEEFKRLFGSYPKINIMHSNNLENIYWGKNIFRNGFLRKIMGLLSYKCQLPFGGENEKSPYFWGDICREKTKYVRLWGTSDINTLKFNPSMPYHDIENPYVNYWFSFSDGYNAEYFKKLLSDKNIKKLVKERGVCIVYTHFSDGFSEKQGDGTYIVKEPIRIQIEILSRQKEGWFAPASEILDRLLAMKKVIIQQKGKLILIFNYNGFPIPGITLLTKPGRVLYGYKGDIYTANEDGEISIGALGTGEIFGLYTSGKNKYMRLKSVGILEKTRLIFERTKILLFSHGMLFKK